MNEPPSMKSAKEPDLLSCGAVWEKTELSVDEHLVCVFCQKHGTFIGSRIFDGDDQPKVIREWSTGELTELWKERACRYYGS